MGAERPNKLRVSWDVVTFYENKPAFCNGLDNALYQRVRVESLNKVTLEASQWL
jgi:hypothetical protein